MLRSSSLPLWLKLLYSAWAVVLLPTYWETTPLQLLWSCNVALLVTWVGLWLESRLLVSMAALGILWWQLLWVVDFSVHLATGLSLMGMSTYMFSDKFSVFSRALSLYHFWLPFVLIWALFRLRYDPRALVPQTLLAWTVFGLSALLTSDLNGPAGNLNMIYGLSETTPQAWMSARLWVVFVMVAWPLTVYVPSHFALKRLVGRHLTPS
jgi:hypothetical protein